MKIINSTNTIFCFLITISMQLPAKTSVTDVIHAIAETPKNIPNMIRTTKDMIIIVGTLSAITIIYKVGFMKYAWDIVRTPTRIALINKRTETIQSTQTQHGTQLSEIQAKLLKQEELIKNIATKTTDIEALLQNYLRDFDLFKQTTNLHYDNIIRNIQSMQAAMLVQNRELRALIEQQVKAIIPILLIALKEASQEPIHSSTTTKQIPIKKDPQQSPSRTTEQAAAN